MATDIDNPRLWVSRRELQAILKKGRAQVDDDRKRLDYAHERKEGGRVLIYLPDWLETHWLARLQPSDEDSDLEPGAGGSPWLEEYRKQRARLAKLQYDQESKSVMPIDDVHRGYGLVAGHLRAALHQLCQDCRPRVDTALDDADAEVSQAFGQNSESESDE